MNSFFRSLSHLNNNHQGSRIVIKQLVYVYRSRVIINEAVNRLLISNREMGNDTSLILYNFFFKQLY